jgi:hypothetical protein
MIKISVLMFSVVLISACSNKSLYENIQANNQFACNNVANSQYDECMERSNVSYEEYEEKRTGEVFGEGSLDY